MYRKKPYTIKIINTCFEQISISKTIGKRHTMKLRFLFLCITMITSLSAIVSNNPYEWLENSESVQVQDWVTQQRALFNDYMVDKTVKDDIKNELKNLTNLDTYSIPRKIGAHYFFTSKKSSEKQSKLYVQSELHAIPQLIFDPDSLHTNASIENYIVSPNGNYLACGTSENGSDWLTYRVIDMSSKLNLADQVEKIKFSPIVWSVDSQGFYYSRFDSETLHSVHYHALGSAQSEDRLIYRDLSDGSVGYTPFISKDNRYLIIDAFNGSSGPNSISLLDLESVDSMPTKIISCDGANYWFVCSKGTKFYFLTNKDADFVKVIYVDIDDKEYTKKDFIREGKFLLESIVPIGDYFCVVTSENVANKLALFDNQGNFVEYIPLPSTGRVSLSRITQNSIETGNEIFFSFTNFFQPQTIYHYQVGSAAPKVFKDSTLAIDSSQLEIEQVFYPSKDGTKVPMFIAHKKGIKLDGSNQTLLTGYGAYGINNYPVFNASYMLWLDRGGVLALANIRGGGEYGKSWHKGAMRENKQNSFDDFIAAAEWLIKNKYTKPTHLAAIGMSSGGLLVAASANQRPDLFKAIVVEAGLLDMLRFHLFTVGRFWITEHGNPDDPNDSVYLSKYSPCHNIGKAAKYPSVLVTASEHDDRVVPSHSYKYVAALQNAHKESNILLRLSANLGHDSSKSTEWINERADVLTFIYQELESKK